MTEEEKIFAGQLFCPGDPALKAIKLRAHKLQLAQMPQVERIVFTDDACCLHACASPAKFYPKGLVSFLVLLYDDG